jgi:glucan exporter ATP-binding protein
MSTAPLLLRAAGLLAGERRALGLLGLAAVMVAVLALAEPILFGRVVDVLAREGPILPWLAAWAALGAVGIVGNVALALGADRLAHRVRLAVIARGFAHALQLPTSYHGARGSASVVRGILAAADGMFATTLGLFREQLPGLFGVLLLAPAACAMDWRLAAVLAVLGAVFVISNGWVLTRTASAQLVVEGHYAEVSGRLGDVIANLSVVHSFDRMRLELADLQQRLRALLAVQYPVLTWWSVVTVFTRASSTITLIAVLMLGATLVERGELGIGELVAFIGFAGILIARLDAASSFVVRTFAGAPTLSSLFEMLDTPVLSDTPGAEPLPEPVRGEIRFEGVSFSYPGGAGVMGLDFTVGSGETVALVGPSGSGKSTTLALLQRILEPDAGRISIDGAEIREICLSSLRQALSVVPQDPGLLRRSIAANLRLGREGATEGELARVAALVDAEGFIERQGGWDCLVGEHGATLSGGERQRLAIARAVIKDAPILLLDEATSALDTETERRIRERLRSERTTLIVTHRLSTVIGADMILVFDQGRIVERGTFSSLLASGGRFASLVREGLLQESEPDARWGRG